MAREIVTIAAAPGWSAKFDTIGGEPRVVTLLAWALVEGDGHERHVVGLVQRPGTPEEPTGRIALADEIEGFDGYTVSGLPTKPAADR